MRIKHIFLFVFFVFALSCSEDDNKVRIDYVKVTEKRLMEVSEQERISDEDIDSLERLIAKVENATEKERFNKILEDVKRIKFVIPEIVKLRTDDEIDFQVKYSEIKGVVEEISDEIPRKAKLMKALEDAQNSYNVDEIEFDSSKGGFYKEIDGFPDEIRVFLEENYGIKPLEGNPYRYKRAEIESVDSLHIKGKNIFSDGSYVGCIWNINLKKFKKLKFLKMDFSIDDINGGVADFSSLKYLEKLYFNYMNIFNIEGCDNLKIIWTGLKLNAAKLPDMSNGNPNLEEINIGGNSKTNIESIVIKNKPHLKYVKLGNLGFTKSITIEGSGNTVLRGFSEDYPFFTFSKEVELNLSGMREILVDFNKTDDQWKSVMTSLSIANSPNLEKLGLIDFYLPQAIDLANYPKLKYLVLLYSSVNSYYVDPNERTLEMLKMENNIKNFDKLPLDIEVLIINDYFYPNNSKVLDLGKYKKINRLQLGKTIYLKEGAIQSLEKLIIDRQVYESIKNNYEYFRLRGLSEHQVEIELVD